MAHSVSTKKRIRQNEKRRIQNKGYRSNLRSTIKKAFTDIKAKNTESLNLTLTDAVSVLDKAVNKGLIHRNQAARRKSRMVKKANEVLKS